jgi:hypothetical protein
MEERYWIWWGCGRALLDLEGSWESATGFGDPGPFSCSREKALPDVEGSWESATGFGGVSSVGLCHMIAYKNFFHGL